MGEFGKWIPCSERLPDKEGNYLVWNSATKTMNVCGFYIVATNDQREALDLVKYHLRDKISNGALDRIAEVLTTPQWGMGGRDVNITAWMELPEPFEK